MSKASDLEDRLINFSVSVFTQTKNIANTRDYRFLVDQFGDQPHRRPLTTVKLSQPNQQTTSYTS
jgi:hypothetical protein